MRQLKCDVKISILYFQQLSILKYFKITWNYDLVLFIIFSSTGLTTVLPAGTSCKIIAPAPILELAPISTFPRINA